MQYVCPGWLSWKGNSGQVFLEKVHELAKNILAPGYDRTKQGQFPCSSGLSHPLLLAPGWAPLCHLCWVLSQCFVHPLSVTPLLPCIWSQPHGSQFLHLQTFLGKVPALFPETLCAQTLMAAVLFFNSASLRENVLNFFLVQSEGKLSLPSADV